MPQIMITATNEQIKAMESFVPDVQAWAQASFNGKAANAIENVMHEEIGKTAYEGKSNQERSDWIRDNTVKTRSQRDAAQNP